MSIFNDEPCMDRPTLIYVNHVELKYYPLMISLNKCTGSCNVLSPKTCVPKETKDINIKAFNNITNENEAKAMTEHISCDCKCNSILQHVTQIKNGIIKHANVNVKIARILAHVFVRTVNI